MLHQVGLFSRGTASSLHVLAVWNTHLINLQEQLFLFFFPETGSIELLRKNSFCSSCDLGSRALSQHLGFTEGVC